MRFLQILLIILCFSCSKKDNIDAIIIKYLDWELFTYIRVDCDKIESYAEQLDQLNLTNADTIKKILAYVDQLKSINNSRESDVRIKLEIMSLSKMVSTLCIGNNGIMQLNGKSVQYNKELVSYLRKLGEGKNQSNKP